jgi:hypothetical protein
MAPKRFNKYAFVPSEGASGVHSSERMVYYLSYTTGKKTVALRVS